MSFCGTISTGATYDCAEPIQSGLLPYIILINTNDISTITYSSNVITNITLKSGKTAYQFDGIRQSIHAEYEKRDLSLISGYTHKVRFQVYDISTTQKLNLEKLCKGNIIAITFNINAPGNSNTYFEVFGAGAGMEAEALRRSNIDTETNASFTVEMATSESIIEASLPNSFFDTDYSTTLAKINGLLSAGSTIPLTIPFTIS